MDEGALLAATMTDQATITREVWSGNGYRTQVIYRGLACALSRAPQSVTPGLTGEWAELIESGSRMMLFFPAGTMIQAGDRGEVFRGGRIFRGICGACMPYSSHCQTAFLLQEVELV